MTAPPARVDASLIEELRSIVGDRLSTAMAVREQHGRDEFFSPLFPPEAVVFAETTAEVSAIVAACARHHAPVIPFGTGTSVEGHFAAIRGGVTIDLGRMERIVPINAADMDATVEAGVTRKRLNAELRDTGLFFPVDPGADASLGGMAATRASGTSTVRYGAMRENVIAMTVVLADGAVIRTARRARKSSAGYDLTRLFVGSEGTLGVITEVTVRLHPIPEAIAAAVVSFADVGAAVAAVVDTIQAAVPIARIELFDEVQMAACNAFSNLDYPEQPTLFLEFHGTEAGVAEQVETVEEICAEYGGGDFRWTARTEDRDRLWSARHDAAYAAKALRPGCRVWPTDVCVPISRLTECIVETREDLDASGLTAPIVGHVGDGNFHVAFVIDPDDGSEIAEVKRLNDRLIKRALAMDGTCTGEHGIGLGKLDHLEAEHGPAVDVMRSIKRALDPADIMNPGKTVRL